MIQTENLKLEKYELDDAANLADGYNNSMDKIDNFAGTINAHFPITSADIEDGTITAVDIANGSITENKLATAAVTNSKLAVDSVDVENLKADSVTNAAIANGAITTEKIDAAAVTSEKIANQAIGISQINNNAIDSIPTENSNNLVSSGGIHSAIEEATAIQKDIMLVFGDSWVDFSGGNVDWITPLINATNTELKNFGVGGARFSGTTNLIQSQLTTALNELTTDEKNRVKYILVCGGINDTRNATGEITEFADTLSSTISAFLDIISNSFNNCVIQYMANFANPATSDNLLMAAYGMTLNLNMLMFKNNTPNVVINKNSAFFYPYYNSSEVLDNGGFHLTNLGGKLFTNIALYGFGFLSEKASIPSALGFTNLNVDNFNMFAVYINNVCKLYAISNNSATYNKGINFIATVQKDSWIYACMATARNQFFSCGNLFSFDSGVNIGRWCLQYIENSHDVQIRAFCNEEFTGRIGFEM